jgi:HK97 family phage portal protein
MLFNGLAEPTTERTERKLTLTETLSERRMLSSGRYLTPIGAIQKVAVFAAANLIAQTVTQLPIDLFRGDGPKKVEIQKGPLLTDPGGNGYGFADWAWSVLFRCVLQGNAVGIINGFDTYGFPTGIHMQNIEDVNVKYDDNGKVKWKIRGTEYDADKIFHLRAYPDDGHIMGLSPIGLHMRTIGIGIQAEEFGSNFFADGAHPTGILTSEAKLDQAQAQTVKSRFMAALRGSREPIVLPADIKYQQIQINPLESQFLETQKYSAAECARIFGPGVPEMLGYETGGTMTYANVEQRSLHLLIYTLNAWACRLEAALSTGRMTPRGQFVRFNRNALLQATTIDRFRAHEIALKNGFEYINEVRELEDRPPVAWGDEPFTPLGPTTKADDTQNEDDKAVTT